MITIELFESMKRKYHHNIQTFTIRVLGVGRPPPPPITFDAVEQIQFFMFSARRHPATSER